MRKWWGGKGIQFRKKRGRERLDAASHYLGDPFLEGNEQLLLWQSYGLTPRTDFGNQVFVKAVFGDF